MDPRSIAGLRRAEVSPVAEGDGRYEAVAAAGAVVAVVGSAHVRGIAGGWEAALDDLCLDSYMQY